MTDDSLNPQSSGTVYASAQARLEHPAPGAHAQDADVDPEESIRRAVQSSTIEMHSLRDKV